MYKKASKIILFSLITAFVVSCSHHENYKKEITPREINLVPLHKFFAQKDSASLFADTILLKNFFDVVYPRVPLETAITLWPDSKPVQIFTPAVDSVYGNDLKELKHQLSYIVGACDAYDIKIPNFNFVTIVYGRREPIGISDSTFFIALNHYLGKDYEGYSSFPLFEKVTKTPEQLPYDIAEAIVGWTHPFRPKDGENESVLEYMLYDGALAFARKNLVENGTDLGALGLTEVQYDWFVKNRDNLWKELVNKQLLYDKNPLTIRKLFSPSPGTSILNEESPGRAGRFLGYDLIKHYFENNPDASFEEVLSPEFYSDANSLLKINR